LVDTVSIELLCPVVGGVVGGSPFGRVVLASLIWGVVVSPLAFAAPAAASPLVAAEGLLIAWKMALPASVAPVVTAAIKAKSLSFDPRFIFFKDDNPNRVASSRRLRACSRIFLDKLKMSGRHGPYLEIKPAVRNWRRQSGGSSRCGKGKNSKSLIRGHL
jgi:hypothetical protein